MTTGLVFDIQHYAVHDGPGIRTLVFLKGCPLRCVWCCNPESQEPGPELRHAAARCRTCHRCVELCPHGAVSSGPVFDRSKCARCDERPCIDGCFESALAQSGRRMTAARVLDRVAADLDFYRNSGGGVTISGGEPFSQRSFLLAILEGCHDLGIHTAVETCGHAPSPRLIEAEPLIDLFLFDLKLADPAAHARLTGQDNSLVIGNLRLLARRCPRKLAVRMPVIPGCTDSDDNVAGIAGILRDTGIQSIELQPYHSLGGFKYTEIGKPIPFEGELEASALARVKEGFLRAGLTVVSRP